MEFGLKNNRINKKFTDLAAKGDKCLITYIMAGDPDLAVTVQLVKTLAASGADIIELGVPFSDPLADGPSIQLAGQRALSAGVKLSDILAMVKRLRLDTQVPIVLMSYYNPLLQFGLDGFALAAADCGVDGIIIPDLPWDESGEFADKLAMREINLIPLVAPTSTGERIAQVAQRDNGFVYCVSLTGVTGARSQLPSGAAAFLKSVKGKAQQPICVGFGISNPEQAREISEHADGVIVGSAIVNIIDKYAGEILVLEAEIAQFVGTLKKSISK